MEIDVARAVSYGMALFYALLAYLRGEGEKANIHLSEYRQIFIFIENSAAAIPIGTPNCHSRRPRTLNFPTQYLLQCGWS
jgi:hypothetical protein